uniref:Major capsid protein N-terminal domain-containing protein n=1 Tax=viral metagenome TaxID=1070528 RepID=A0A6C0DHK7_9ZZZZ
MVASLLKPLTTGIQNERIFFKQTFAPFVRLWHTTGRFTTQMVRLDFDSAPVLGGTSFFRLLRKGQLITRLFLVANMPDIETAQAIARAKAGAFFAGPTFGWTNSIGHALVESTTMNIGNTEIETLDSRLLEMMDEFQTPLEKTTTMNRLIKRLDNGFTSSTFGHDPVPTQVVVPLPFWFCRGDAGCAFPIDAILSDEVRIGITFRNVNGMYYTDSRNVNNTSTDDGTGLWPLLNSPFYAYLLGGGTVVPGIDPVRPVGIIPGINMPNTLSLGDTYIMAEYVYLDQPEANRFRMADLQVPIVQHYAVQPFQTRGLANARIPIEIPNPTRDLFWMVQRVEAPTYNAHFLATRDLTAVKSDKLWWPNATGLSAFQPSFLTPAFALSDSEPIIGVALMYQGSLTRFRTQTPALYRSILPSWEQKKSPWINRFYYNFPVGLYSGYTPVSKPLGEGNLDKMSQRELLLEFTPRRGTYNQNDVPSYDVYIWAETYNVLRVYGGRAGLLFAY